MKPMARKVLRRFKKRILGVLDRVAEGKEENHNNDEQNGQKDAVTVHAR